MNYPGAGRLSLAASALLLIGVFGCSGGGKMAVSSEAMYDRGALDEFVRETGPAAGATPEYQIGIGDRLDVIFLYHSNLTTRNLLVRDDGRISLPHVGDQMAMGLTPMELDSVLTERFSEILRQPNLSVIVNQPAEKLVYVLGKVSKPGGYPFERPVSLLSALALAGGVERGGKPKNTVLIRRTTPTEVVGIEIDAEAIMNGSGVQNDVLLRNYDIVYVPQSRMNSVEEFAKSLTNILDLPVGTTLAGWQIVNTIEQYKYFQKRNASEEPF